MDLKTDFIRNANILDEYISQNSKVRNILEKFVNLPKIIQIETSNMGNPAYIVLQLAKIWKDLPSDYKKKSDLIKLRNRVIAGMLFWSGLRVSELKETKREDIDLITKTWNVFTLKQRRDVLYRPIPLDHVPTKELSLWNKYFEAIKAVPETKLFNMSRRMLENITVNEIGISPHKFRHALGLFLYEMTQDIRIVSQILRHKNIANTLLYTRLNMEGIREKININGENDAI